MVDDALSRSADAFMRESIQARYSYGFSWLGRPVIQYPQDIVAVQELVWAVRPDLIIETGIAHGGSLILSASLLALLDVCDASESGTSFDPRACRRRVLAVDVDIRAHNRAAIEAHPLAPRIDMLQGSSIADDIIAEVHARAASYRNVMVFLDSNHTHDHVLAELEAYAPLVSPGSYCVAFDTIVERLPKSMYPDRSWGPGDNPMTAVHAFLKTHPEFAIDSDIQNRLLITVAPDGYLKRTGAVPSR
jgi:cephalosporin hydroxylase